MLLPAISIRQPWAGLIVAGRKRIEIRHWSTSLRGRLLIHASKTRDERREALYRITPDVEALCSLTGGVIGLVDLIECQEYRTRDQFVRAAADHLNLPEWFDPPAMYGFCLATPIAVPFHRCSGQTRFFYVGGVTVPPVIFPPEYSP